MPTKEEMEEGLKDINKHDKIFFIIKYGLNFDLLPRNEKEICLSESSLGFYSYMIEKLPNNLTVIGNLNCMWNSLTELPKGLRVIGDFDCRLNKLTELPDDLYVFGDLDCRDNPEYLELPESATVEGKFINGKLDN